jgi:hypothetical protein
VAPIPSPSRAMPAPQAPAQDSLVSTTHPGLRIQVVGVTVTTADRVTVRLRVTNRTAGRVTIAFDYKASRVRLEGVFQVPLADPPGGNEPFSREIDAGGDVEFTVEFQAQPSSSRYFLELAPASPGAPKFPPIPLRKPGNN